MWTVGLTVEVEKEVNRDIKIRPFCTVLSLNPSIRQNFRSKSRIALFEYFLWHIFFSHVCKMFLFPFLPLAGSKDQGFGSFLVQSVLLGWFRGLLFAKALTY